MQKGQEVVNLKITKDAFEVLYNHGLIDLKTSEFFIKSIDIHEEEYPDDERWVELKETSKKAYKELKDYEFFKRNKNTNTSNSK